MRHITYTLMSEEAMNEPMNQVKPCERIETFKAVQAVQAVERVDMKQMAKELAREEWERMAYRPSGWPPERFVEYGYERSQNVSIR